MANHPGGSEKIMLAAGKAIDPFWNLYRQHYSSSAPAELLAEMRIGTLDPNEAPLEVDATNPYSNDPARHPGLVFHRCALSAIVTCRIEHWRIRTTSLKLPPSVVVRPTGCSSIAMRTVAFLCFTVRSLGGVVSMVHLRRCGLGGQA